MRRTEFIQQSTIIKISCTNIDFVLRLTVCKYGKYPNLLRWVAKQKGLGNLRIFQRITRDSWKMNFDFISCRFNAIKFIKFG